MTTFRCSLWTHTDGHCCPDGTICPNSPGVSVDEPAVCQAATAARRRSGAPAQSSAARRGTDVSENEKVFWLSPTLALFRTPPRPAPRGRSSLTRFMVALLLGGLLLALFGSLALMTTHLAEIEQHLAWEARV